MCKSAFNALHVTAPEVTQPGRRGPLRDAVTLLDESGLLLLSDDRRLLAALRQQDWRQAFVTLREAWADHTRMLVSGHAVLEKLLDPYKAITAKALLILVPGHVLNLPWAQVDQLVSGQLLAHKWLQRPRDLAALPVMGVPGWWASTPQDSKFYADQDVFRAPGPGWSAAPLLEWPDPDSCSAAACR